MRRGCSAHPTSWVLSLKAAPSRERTSSLSRAVFFSLVWSILWNAEIVSAFLLRLSDPAGARSRPSPQMAAVAVPIVTGVHPFNGSDLP
jgi:hypothetical protein